MNDITKKDRIKGTFFGAIVGDALCLGSHYEYERFIKLTETKL